MKFDKILIRDFITIRYHPSLNKTRFLTKWDNFEAKTSDPNGKITEQLLSNSIKNSIRHRFAVDLLRYIIPNDLIGDWGALGD